VKNWAEIHCLHRPERESKRTLTRELDLSRKALRRLLDLRILLRTPPATFGTQGVREAGACGDASVAAELEQTARSTPGGPLADGRHRPPKPARLRMSTGGER
jgi:hypothetical protein